MTPTTCVPDAYTSSSVCIGPPTSEVHDATTTTVAVRPSSSLPITGQDIGLIAIWALALIFIGVCVTRWTNSYKDGE